MWGNVRSTVRIAAVALLAVGCKASFERTMPRALTAHTAGLQSSSEIQVSVESSWSARWNRIAGAVASACGVSAEDVNQGVLQSHFCYESSGDALVARQSRTRFVVRFPPGATSIENLSVDAITEIRERGAGSALGAWVSSSPNTAQAQAIRRAIEAATASRRTLPIHEVRFEEEPDAALRRLSQRMSPYVEAERTEDGLVTEWRTTSEAVGDGSLILRSRLRFFAERGNDGTEISVVAQLQSRRIEDNAAPPPTENWSDLDPTPVLAHGLGVVQESLRPASIAIGDEPIQAFASAAPVEPDLADPVATWDRGRLPENILATTETESGLVLLTENSSPAELLGRVYDSSLVATQGRVTPMGPLVETLGQGVEMRFRQIDFEGEIAANASYLGIVSGSISNTSTQRIVTFSAIQHQTRVALPEYGQISGLSPDAAYFVAEVILGRAVDAIFQVDESRLVGEIGASYDGFSASVRSSASNRAVQCRMRFRGVEHAPPCTPASPPTVEAMQRSLAAPAGNAVPVYLLLRRVPDRFRPGNRTFDIELRAIRAASTGAGVNDLRVTVHRHGSPPMTLDCPDDQNHCVFGWDNQAKFRAENVPFGTQEVLGIGVTDRDFFSHDHLGNIAVPLADVVGATPVERRPVGSQLCRTSNFRSSFELTFCVHDR